VNPRKDISIYLPHNIYELAKSDDKNAYHELICDDTSVRLYFDYDSEKLPFP
jgi:hypothetical protein